MNGTELWCTIGSWPPAAHPSSEPITTCCLSSFIPVPPQGGKEEELAEEEKEPGQTVRGKGSMGPGCPGEGDLLLQKSPHQASSYRPGPRRGVLPACSEVSGMDKRE